MKKTITALLASTAIAGASYDSWNNDLFGEDVYAMGEYHAAVKNWPDEFYTCEELEEIYGVEAANRPMGLCWFVNHNNGIANGTLDGDGDGILDVEEYIFGYHPGVFDDTTFNIESEQIASNPSQLRAVTNGDDIDIYVRILTKSPDLEFWIEGAYERFNSDWTILAGQVTNLGDIFDPTLEHLHLSDSIGYSGNQLTWISLDVAESNHRWLKVTLKDGALIPLKYYRLKYTINSHIKPIKETRWNSGKRWTKTSPVVKLDFDDTNNKHRQSHDGYFKWLKGHYGSEYVTAGKYAPVDPNKRTYVFTASSSQYYSPGQYATYEYTSGDDLYELHVTMENTTVPNLHGYSGSGVKFTFNWYADNDHNGNPRHLRNIKFWRGLSGMDTHKLYNGTETDYPIYWGYTPTHISEDPLHLDGGKLPILPYPGQREAYFHFDGLRYQPDDNLIDLRTYDPNRPAWDPQKVINEGLVSGDKYEIFLPGIDLSNDWFNFENDPNKPGYTLNGRDLEKLTANGTEFRLEGAPLPVELIAKRKRAMAGTADTDGDGVSDLKEYGFGGNPFGDDSGNEKLGQLTIHRRWNTMYLEYIRNQEAGDFDTWVEGSNDLSNWEPLPDGVVLPAENLDQQIDVPLNPGKYKKIIVQVGTADVKPQHKYFRLRYGWRDNFITYSNTIGQLDTTATNSRNAIFWDPRAEDITDLWAIRAVQPKQ